MDVSFADNLASLDTHSTYSHSKGSPMPIFNITNQSPICLNALLSQAISSIGQALDHQVYTLSYHHHALSSFRKNQPLYTQRTHAHRL